MWIFVQESLNLWTHHAKLCRWHRSSWAFQRRLLTVLRCKSGNATKQRRLNQSKCVCKSMEACMQCNQIEHDFSFMIANKFVDMLDRDVECSDAGLFRKLTNDGFSRDEISRIFIDLLIASVDTVSLLLRFEIQFCKILIFLSSRARCYRVQQSANTALFLLHHIAKDTDIQEKYDTILHSTNETRQHFDNFPKRTITADCEALPKQPTMLNFHWWEEHCEKSSDSIRRRHS